MSTALSPVRAAQKACAVHIPIVTQGFGRFAAFALGCAASRFQRSFANAHWAEAGSCGKLIQSRISVALSMSISKLI